MREVLQPLQQALGSDRDELAQRWVESVVRRTWQLRGKVPMIQQLRERCSNVLEALAIAVKHVEDVQLGAPEWRESLQRLSFAAGWMAGVDLPISAAPALCYGLRDAVSDLSGMATPAAAARFYEDLVLVSTEAYNAGVRQQAAARHRQIVEKAQVVCMIEEKLPCMFLVADPDRQALDDAVGRLMMLAVVRDAKAIVVDVGGALDAERTARLVLPILADHCSSLAEQRSEPPPPLLLASVTPALVKILTSDASLQKPGEMRCFEQVAEAIGTARGLGSTSAA